MMASQSMARSITGFSAVLCLLACETESPPTTQDGRCDRFRDEQPSGDTDAFSIVVLPDTQFYAERYPEIFESQAAWIRDNVGAQDIAFVLHEGDIVNRNVPEQWDVASTALHSLDAVVPYVLAAGNHDLRPGMFGLTREADFFNEHFPVAMHDDHSWFCGSYAEDDMQNSYALLDGGGRKWLVLALEFGPRDEVLAWANDVLSDFAQYPAIIVTHAYMYLGDDRYDHVGQPMQEFSPYQYGIEGSINDGEEMWAALVAPNPNVKLVFSGHMLWPGVGRLTSRRADDSLVHQLLANYQTCPSADPCMHPDSDQMYRGGNGFLRVVALDQAQASATISTYSPYLDAAKTDPDNAFVLDLAEAP
jgi:hypothetical protein